MNRLLDYGTLLAIVLLVVAMCAVNAANTLSAACPDQAPDPDAYCQSTELKCSQTTIDATGVCASGIIVTGCAKEKETRTKGPFDTKFAAGQKTKRGAKQDCVEKCDCVLSTNPSQCLITCGPSTDPLKCQTTLGDTVLADGACAGGG